MREASVASSRLANLINIARLRIKWSACLSLWTNCYSYATILAPAFITAPMYFRGEIEFGTISQVCYTPTSLAHICLCVFEVCNCICMVAFHLPDNTSCETPLCPLL